MDKSSSLNLAREAKNLKKLRKELASVTKEKEALQLLMEKKCNEYIELQNEMNTIARNHYLKGEADMKRSTTQIINNVKQNVLEWKNKFLECNRKLLIEKNKLVDYQRLDGSIDLCNNQLQSQITMVSGILQRKFVFFIYYDFHCNLCFFMIGI